MKSEKKYTFPLHVLALHPQLQNNGVNTDKSHFYQMFLQNKYIKKPFLQDKIQ